MLVSTKELAFQNEDVVITDPCYVVMKDDWPNYCDYLEKHGAFDKSVKKGFGALETAGLQSIGIIDTICANTIWGDWVCRVIRNNKTPRRKIGEFCADAGLVAVFRLGEVKEYNSNYNIKKETACGLATLIKNFTGTIKIINKDDKVQVVGDGNVHFYSEQIG